MPCVLPPVLLTASPSRDGIGCCYRTNWLGLVSTRECVYAAGNFPADDTMEDKSGTY
jgi:hypothetical protein